MTAKIRNDINNKTSLKRYAILVFFLVFLIYGNSIKNKYSIDDNYVTVTTPQTPNNERIAKGIKGIPEIFTTHFVEQKDQSFEYRPLALSTFAVEYQLFGSNPHISHFISVLIYACSCVLILLILFKLFKNYHATFPVLCTLLFLVHPIHTEVVCNIKCRDELLAFFFGLCSLWFVIKMNDTGKWGYIVLAAIFLLFALLCKKTAILFVAIIPLTNYFFTKTELKKIVLQVVLFYFVFVVFTIMEQTLLPSTPEKRVFAFFENPLFYENNFLIQIGAAFYTLGYYFKLFVFPYPLSCYYGFNTIPITDWGSLFVIISAVFHFTIGIYAMFKLPKRSILSYGILIYFIGIYPFSNLLTPVVGIIGERLVYIASLGFCISAICFLFEFFKIEYKNNTMSTGMFGSLPVKIMLPVLLFFSILTIARNNKWKDELTLLRTDATKFDESCNLHYILGNDLYKEVFQMNNGTKKEQLVRETIFHDKKAILLMKEGVKLYPSDFTTLSNIGTLYVNVLNDAASAQTYFKKSLKINPGDPVTQYNFIYCYERKGKIDSAIAGYEELIGHSKTYPLAYLRLHELYLQRKEYRNAIICDEKAIKNNPENPMFYINLGNALILNKDSSQALDPFRRALELDPNNANLRNQIEQYIKSAK